MRQLGGAAEGRLCDAHADGGGSIESLSNSLCIELTLVDSSTPRAVVEIPQSIQEKVECRIVGTELRLRCRKGYDNCGSSSDPIRVRIESSGMRLINNMGVLTLKYRNKRLDELEIRNAGVCDWKADRLAIGNLTVSNSGVFDIDVRSIDARTVTMQNSGRYTCDVSTLSCDKWESINSGVSGDALGCRGAERVFPLGGQERGDARRRLRQAGAYLDRRGRYNAARQCR